MSSAWAERGEPVAQGRTADLFGRDDEVAAVAALLDAAGAGSGSALVIRGEPGIGKSALLGVARERGQDMRVLEARAVEAESELPYATLSQLLGPVLGLRSKLSARQRAALEGALALAAPHTEDRFAAYAAALGIIAEAADDVPLLVLADDAHWLDTATAEALRFVARRIANDPVALVFAARIGEGVGFDPGDLPELSLTGLGQPATAALLEARAGTPVAASVAERLWAATAGNPLALTELATMLGQGEFAGREPLPDPLPVGRRVEVLFRRQVAVLPDRARRAVLLAAASTTGEPSEIVPALAALGLDERDLEVAEAAGIVRLSSVGFEFRHPLMRSAAYHAAPAAERRAAHHALGDVLAGHAPGASAWHLAAASVGPDEALAARLEEAARDTRARGAPVAAARAFAEAARLTPPGQGRVVRLLEASRDFGAAGRVEQAVALLDEAATMVRDARLRADVAHARARVQFMQAAPEATFELLTREADRVELIDPFRAAAMRVDAGFMAQALARPPDALRLTEQAYPHTQHLGGPLGLIGGWALGSALILAGRRREALPLLVAAERLLQSPEALSVPFIAAGIGHHRLWTEEHARGQTLLARVVARAREASAVSALPYALACLAEAHMRLGHWSAAYAVATESVALAEEIGQVTELSHSLVRLAAIEAGQGRGDECRAHVRRAYEIAERQGVRSIFTLGGSTLGLLEVGLGRYAQAIAVLEPTGRGATEDGLRQPAVAPWAQELAEAYIRHGEPSSGEAVVADLEALAEAADSRGALAAVERCRGLLADVGRFEEHFREALRRHEAVEAPFERARTELCFGERLRRAGRRLDAREQLRRALSTFGGLGALPWIERAARELEATGERARPRTPVSRDRLTAQETQVALAIAEGQTNREAAAALFVSPKTIEAHLSRIYRKLGIRSRSELTRLMLQEADAAPEGPVEVVETVT
jgi:DNA-binding CsgD family transcriptional regulator